MGTQEAEIGERRTVETGGVDVGGSECTRGDLTSRQVLALLRVRWQVELLFKLWKSHAKVDEWRSHNPWRILCEIYAKLIGLVLSHWLFAVSLWPHPDRSLFQAAKTVQKWAVPLALAIGRPRTSSETRWPPCVSA